METDLLVHSPRLHGPGDGDRARSTAQMERLQQSNDPARSELTSGPWCLPGAAGIQIQLPWDSITPSGGWAGQLLIGEDEVLHCDHLVQLDCFMASQDPKASDGLIFTPWAVTLRSVQSMPNG